MDRYHPWQHRYSCPCVMHHPATRNPRHTTSAAALMMPEQHPDQPPNLMVAAAGAVAGVAAGALVGTSIALAFVIGAVLTTPQSGETPRH